MAKPVTTKKPAKRAVPAAPAGVKRGGPATASKSTAGPKGKSEPAKAGASSAATRATATADGSGRAARADPAKKRARPAGKTRSKPAHAATTAKARAASASPIDVEPPGGAAATSESKKGAKKSTARRTKAGAVRGASASGSSGKSASPRKGGGKSVKGSTKAAAKPASRPRERAASAGARSGKQLVIVESPAKAKTINKYLGPGFVVKASIGHIRDLPSRSPKGKKMPVPGVDLDDDFAPTYEILAAKTKTVAELKREAKGASQIWFATDLDREGEAIAWHLAQVLGIEASSAKRVVFNAITRDEIQRAFAKPRPIDGAKVQAQQARRILDRIVGYQASPLLWKKVARGLSAGRVQSVAVRMIVDREREIEAFVPNESWTVEVRLASDAARAGELMGAWQRQLAAIGPKGRGPTVKDQNRWMAEHLAVRAELVELGGKRFALGCPADAPRDLSAEIARVAEQVGMRGVEVESTEMPEAKGPARFQRRVIGSLDPVARYRVREIETKRTQARPPAPFITSSLQIAAANQLGFSASRTMRLAQDLYEGVTLAGEGQVGLITYMRTDATFISGEAIAQVREFVDREYGDGFLPEKPRFYSSSNKDAQEAHEAIRPTEVSRSPEQVGASLTGPRAEDQLKLYRLIWSRFVACQMADSVWSATNVSFERSDLDSGAVLRASGRVLVFAGFYRVAGVPTAADEQTLPDLERGATVAPFAITPEQKFGSPPPRYSEASLVKALESEGIGRPSTYASIIEVIQRRNYVEQRERRFYATDLGEVVTDKMIEAFPELMDLGYTRLMEGQLDRIEESQVDWVAMLREFYGHFSAALEAAHESMSHAKAEVQPAIYRCPDCGSPTCYRFGKNGRFLSCTTYPECAYAAPIDRRGRPLLSERVDIVCPADGSTMELRNGRFGRFLASENYPQTTFVLNLDKKDAIKYPAVPPLVIEELRCPKCGAAMNLRRGKRGPWLGCSKFPKCRGRVPWNSVDEQLRASLEETLAAHEHANPRPAILRGDGSVIPEGTPIADLAIPGGVAQLELHPDAPVDRAG